MPKSVKKVKHGNVWIREKVGTKFRIGTRKSGKSANLMSNDELAKVLANKDLSKYWSKARAVVSKRLGYV